MGKIITVNVGKLEFWLENYRFGEAKNQKDALRKLENTQHFDALVESIKTHGFQYNNLLTVSKDQTNPDRYLVYDGNRRLAAVKQIHKINTLRVYIESDRKALNAILVREHSNAPDGRLRWTYVQQARWEKALYEQGFVESITDRARCLDILEAAQDGRLDSAFPLSTFERLYSEHFKQQFGVDIDADRLTVRKKDEINNIIKDIQDQKITSRNINTSDNIEQYLKRLLAGQSQDERTHLDDDYADEEDFRGDEEQNPTRLFLPTEINDLKHHIGIKNRYLVQELERAPISRYPHLLTLATRAVLDTLRNIDKDESNVPIALNKRDCETYMRDNTEKKLIRKTEKLVDTLCERAHDLRKVSTHNEINNHRGIVKQLMKCIYQSIDKPKKIRHWPNRS